MMAKLVKAGKCNLNIFGGMGAHTSLNWRSNSNLTIGEPQKQSNGIASAYRKVIDYRQTTRKSS
jgi:hypothetical protein